MSGAAQATEQATCMQLTTQELALVLDALLAEAELQVLVEPGGARHLGAPRAVRLVPVSADGGVLEGTNRTTDGSIGQP